MVQLARRLSVTFRSFIADESTTLQLRFARVPRRQFAGHPTASRADEFPVDRKSIELENRVARLELLVRDLRSSYDEQRRTSASLRAQLDYLMARITGL
jgi:uncharacterized coiled-coil protein SlyX